MDSVCEFIEQRLKLKVNRAKSAVAWAGRRTFLGFSFYKRKDGWKIGVGRDAPKRAKRRLRQLTSRSWGVPMERRIDAINRFTRAGRPTSPSPRASGRSATSMNGCGAGCARCAGRSGSATRPAGATCGPSALPSARPRMGRDPQGAVARRGLLGALPNAHRRLLATAGLLGFTDPYRRLRDAKRTARCGPARRVVWEGPG